MTMKYVALLLVAVTLMFPACQTQSSLTDGETASVSGSLSEITHEPLGKAVIRESGGKLVASNMRTPDDGVRSLYQPSTSWQAALTWAPSVSAVRLNSINSRLSGEDTTSRLALDRVGADEWAVGAQFVSPSHRVNVYSGDRLVGTVSPGQGEALRLRFRITITIYWRFHVITISIGRNSTETTAQQCSWELAVPDGIQVVKGNTVLSGDRIEIIEDAHEPYGGFDEIQVLGNGNVTYLSEQVVTE
jgi:hypothetical protein